MARPRREAGKHRGSETVPSTLELGPHPHAPRAVPAEAGTTLGTVREGRTVHAVSPAARARASRLVRGLRAGIPLLARWSDLNDPLVPAAPHTPMGAGRIW